jgi:hypothetical protein
VPSYRVMLDVPADLIWFVSRLLAARRRSIGTRKNTRKLGCYRQALFGLAWFRDKAGIRRLGAGFGLSQATAYRYLDEVISVLAEQAPGLREALEKALAEGTRTSSLTARSSAPTGATRRRPAGRARKSTCGTRGKGRTSAGTSRPCSTPTPGRCGSRTCFRAM